ANYSRKLGVDVENLLVSQPDSGEQALEIAEVLIRSGAIDIVVVDSVAALVPRAELEGEMGDAQMGLQARLMSQALRKLTGIVSKSRTCLIFINQIREKIGVMFGNPETTRGGWFSDQAERLDQRCDNARQITTDNTDQRHNVEIGLLDIMGPTISTIPPAAHAATADNGHKRR